MNEERRRGRRGRPALAVFPLASSHLCFPPDPNQPGSPTSSFLADVAARLKRLVKEVGYERRRPAVEARLQGSTSSVDGLIALLKCCILGFQRLSLDLYQSGGASDLPLNYAS